MRLRFVLALALAAAWPAASGAIELALRLGSAPVGSLSSIGPNVSNVPSGNGGVNFWAHYSLEPDGGPLEQADLRWLQRVTFSRTVQGFPSPNRPFIDPRAGQPLGSRLGDALPWYDISGSAQNALSLVGGGDDPWMGDGPFAPYTLAPFGFSADTLVVAIDAAARTAVILGGVQWGYALSAAGGTSTTPLPAQPLADSDALRAAFNDALATDFPEWRLVAAPEPSTLTLLLSGLLGAALHARGITRRGATRESRSPRG